MKISQILMVSVVIFTVGCASKPPSKYTQTDLSSIAIERTKTWQICYAGAFADNDILTGHLNEEFVGNILPGFPGFKRKTIIIDNNVDSTLAIQKTKNNATIATFRRGSFKDKDIYIIMDSKTTGGWIIPLPFVVASKLDGTRSITPVDKNTFDNFCGTTTGTVFIRQN